MKKSEATANPQNFRSIFNNLIAHINPTAIIGFTYGSVDQEAASSAYTFPVIEKEEAWNLTHGSNIQSAELHGIKKALETGY